MTNDDFIITTLNLKSEQIRSLSTINKDGILNIYVSLISEYPECPYCGGNVVVKGYSNHTYNHLPIAGNPSIIIYKRTRYKCKDCFKTFSEKSPFGPEDYHQSYAVLFEIVKDLRNINMTYEDIARKHRVSSGIVSLYADSFIHAPRQRLPENMGIDEIHSSMAKYGGSYLCVIVDNNHRTLNELLPDRSKRTLSRFMESIPVEERDEVKFVTIDMWQPYKDISKKYLKNASIAVDPFHVIEHLSSGFTKIRIDIMNKCPYNSSAYYLLKKWHKLLETDSYILDNEPKYNSFFKLKMNYRDLYNMLLKLDPELKKAYELKEMYRTFNRTCRFEDAEDELTQIIEIFEESDLYCYQEFTAILKTWKEEIINSFNRPYDNRKQSNALSENINSRLRKLINVSSGFSNFDRFRSRALYCLNDSLFSTLTSHLISHKRKGRKRGNYTKKNTDISE